MFTVSPQHTLLVISVIDFIVTTHSIICKNVITIAAQGLKEQIICILISTYVQVYKLQKVSVQCVIDYWEGWCRMYSHNTHAIIHIISVSTPPGLQGGQQHTVGTSDTSWLEMSLVVIFSSLNILKLSEAFLQINSTYCCRIGNIVS